MAQSTSAAGEDRKRGSLLGRVSAWWNGAAVPSSPAASKSGQNKTPEAPPPSEGPVPWWDVERKVWGEEFSNPVTGDFLTALIEPLDPESYSELLLLGAGFGGAANDIIVRHGAKVAAHEADEALAEAATAFWAAAPLEKPPIIKPCDLAVATLPARKFDGGLALNAFLPVGDKVAALTRVEETLKVRRKLVILETFPGPDVDPNSEAFEEWKLLEPVRPHLVSYESFVGALEEVGFKVLEQKDVSTDYQALVTDAWAKAMVTLKPPTDGSVNVKSYIDTVMRQCKRWTLRTTLLKEKKLRIYQITAQVGETKALMSNW